VSGHVIPGLPGGEAGTARLLLIDNYDSFTYNLAHLFAELGADVTVVRNDELGIDEARALAPTHLVISPGPGRPEAAGISQEAVAAFAGEIPLLGVCLGHQAIVSVFGGTVGPARDLVHGKATTVSHDGRGLFAGMPPDFPAGRYHSLAATSLPDCLERSASSPDGEVMAVRHRSLAVDGVQFHPESVLTPDGARLARSFVAAPRSQGETPRAVPAASSAPAATPGAARPGRRP
jgi:anthranilate synthase/aminodeoxychorismate synthase-like glutamine amidotransferase